MSKLYFIVATLMFVVGLFKIASDWSTQELFYSIVGSILWVGAYIVTTFAIFKKLIWKS